MEKDWTLVYTVDKQYKAQIVQEILDEAGITAVVINKHDTTYKTFGEYEVYVNQESAEKARTMLQDSKI